MPIPTASGPAHHCGGEHQPKGGGKRKLGIASTKRHRKILRDTIQGVTKGSLRKLARRGGIKRISATIYDEARLALKKRLERLLKIICVVLDGSNRKTCTVEDVVYALKYVGNPIYGFGNPVV